MGIGCSWLPALALLKYLPKATNACGLVTYATPNETAENPRPSSW